MDYPLTVHIDQAPGNTFQLWMPRSFHSQQLVRIAGSWTKTNKFKPICLLMAFHKLVDVPVQHPL